MRRPGLLAAAAGGVVAGVIAIAVVANTRGGGPRELPVPDAFTRAQLRAGPAPVGRTTVTDYRVDASLPSLTGHARAYDVRSGRDQRERTLVAALGFDPARVRVAGGQRTVEAVDRRVRLGTGPDRQWAMTVDDPAPADMETSSPDDAERQARDLLTAAGFDVAQAAVRVHQGALGRAPVWVVQADPVVDGMATAGFGWQVAIGANGPAAAGGFLGVPRRDGTYRLAGAAAGIARLKALAATRDRRAARCRRAASCPTATATITNARVGLALASRAGKSWLVPAYLFDLDNGAVAPVAAVVDDQLVGHRKAKK